MLKITIGLMLFLIGMEFLFFTNRLQCDAQNACREGHSWYRPLSEWIKDPGHLVALRIAGALSMIVSLYILFLAE
ncbi:MAG: hypothetical protein JXM72_08200 [Deltaproteobacteria bacterium]|nr:hypothetical protein [Deltaproteobacteria bacterium]